MSTLNECKDYIPEIQAGYLWIPSISFLQFYTIHHHFKSPQLPRTYWPGPSLLLPSFMRCAQNSSQQRRTSACGVATVVPTKKNHWKNLCAKDLYVVGTKKIQKYKGDLFTLRPSFTCFFFPFRFCCTSRLQSAKSTCTRVDESPGRWKFHQQRKHPKIAVVNTADV